jgi:hypothetical protein
MEPTQSTPLTSSQEEEQPSAVMMTPSPPLTRKRPHIEAFKPDEDKKQSTTRPIIMTTSSHHNKRQRRKERRHAVHFAAVPHQTHLVPRWTEDETASSWYSKHDVFAFKLQETVDAVMIRTLIQAEPTIDTLPQEAAVYRGLERLWSDQTTCEITERRKRCVMGVLIAQQRGLDMELIAQVSKNFSEKAADWALTLGRM